MINSKINFKQDGKQNVILYDLAYFASILKTCQVSLSGGYFCGFQAKPNLVINIFFNLSIETLKTVTDLSEEIVLSIRL